MLQHRSRSSVIVRRAFTLVELLVVIGIIAILIAILLPTLQKARDQSLRTKCAAHMRNVGQSIYIYANDNKGKLPQHNGGSNWLWDIPFPTRDALIKSGNKRETLYCAASSVQPNDQNDNALWNFSGGYCVTGYFWLMRRPTGNLPPLAPPKQYLQEITVKHAVDVELAADPTISQGQSFINVKGGWAGIHSTAHVKRDGRPAGGNILFLDGHVAWRDFGEMRQRAASGNVLQWF